MRPDLLALVRASPSDELLETSRVLLLNDVMQGIDGRRWQAVTKAIRKRAAVFALQLRRTGDAISCDQVVRSIRRVRPRTVIRLDCLKGIGHHGLHRILAKPRHQASALRGVLQHVDGLVQLELASIEQERARLAPRREHLNRIGASDFFASVSERGRRSPFDQRAANSSRMARRISAARSADSSGGWRPAWQPRPMATIGGLTVDPRLAEVPLQAIDFVDEKSGFRGIAAPLGRVALESRKLGSRRAMSRQVGEQNFAVRPVGLTLMGALQVAQRRRAP